MPTLAVTESHSLGQAAAIERLKTFGESLKAEHGDKIRDVVETWLAVNIMDFSFTASTPGPDVEVRGTVTIEDSGVTIDGHLPFRALPWKGQIESTVRENLRKALA